MRPFEQGENALTRRPRARASACRSASHLPGHGRRLGSLRAGPGLDRQVAPAGRLTASAAVARPAAPP